MKMMRTVGLVAALTLGGIGAASAAPMSIASGEVLGVSHNGIEKAYVVCGPYRCLRRPGWRYGYGWRRPWGWHRGWGWRRHWGWRRW